jgi:hypothetical protein
MLVVALAPPAAARRHDGVGQSASDISQRLSPHLDLGRRVELVVSDTASGIRRIGAGSRARPPVAPGRIDGHRTVAFATHAGLRPEIRHMRSFR